MAGYHVGFGTQAPIATHCSGPKLGQPWLSSFWVEARMSSELGKEGSEDERGEGNLGGGT